jgi:hypothetical protein
MKNRINTILVVLTILFLFLIANCYSDDTRPGFATFDQATKWYLSSAALEWMNPESTAISKAAYHKNDRVMIIFFKSKPSKGYIFGKVPISVWQQFNNSPSKGRFYNSVIKGNFKYQLRKD